MNSGSSYAVLCFLQCEGGEECRATSLVHVDTLQTKANRLLCTVHSLCMQYHSDGEARKSHAPPPVGMYKCAGTRCMYICVHVFMFVYVYVSCNESSD